MLIDRKGYGEDSR